MNKDGAGVRSVEADDEPEQYALSCTASAENGQCLSGVDGETDPIENHVLIECFV
jgi:hypothetical protein